MVALYPLMPDRMTVNRSTKDGEIYYTYYKTSTEPDSVKYAPVNLSRQNVFHIPGLGFDGLVGYSPIAIAKNALGLSMSAEEYGSKFFANGAAPSGVLEHPGVIKNPDRLRDSWQNTFGGSGNANKIAVLEAGVRPDRVLSKVEM